MHRRKILVHLCAPAFRTIRLHKNGKQATLILVASATQSAHYMPHSLIHKHIETAFFFFLYRQHFSIRTHTHTHTSVIHQGAFGVQYLAKGHLGIKSLTLRLVDEPFYLLSHSYPPEPFEWFSGFWIQFFGQRNLLRRTCDFPWQVFFCMCSLFIIHACSTFEI